MTDLVLRTADASEIELLRRLYRRSSLSNDGDRTALLANPEALVLPDTAVTQGRTRVAVCDGEIVGFATFQVNDGVAELEDLFVDPDRMRRGIGQALIDDLAVIAHAQGLRRIEVTANQHALAFYEQAGFVHDGVVETRFATAPRMHLDIAG